MQNAKTAFLTAVLALASTVPAFAQQAQKPQHPAKGAPACEKLDPPPCPHDSNGETFTCKDDGKGNIHVKSSKGIEYDLDACKTAQNDWETRKHSREGIEWTRRSPSLSAYYAQLAREEQAARAAQEKTNKPVPAEAPPAPQLK
jgi:hypothetical protein